MKQVTQQEAIKIYDSKLWEDWTFQQRVEFQLFQDRLCMPIDKFKEALYHVLGRPVYTHELSSSNHLNLIMEFLGEKEAPTFDEIVNMIPEKKRIVIFHDQNGQ